MIYDIANLKVEIKNENGRTEKQAIPYLAQNQDEKNIDITIDVDEKRVLQAMKEHPELVQDDWEYMLTGSASALSLSLLNIQFCKSDTSLLIITASLATGKVANVTSSFEVALE